MFINDLWERTKCGLLYPSICFKNVYFICKGVEWVLFLQCYGDVFKYRVSHSGYLAFRTMEIIWNLLKHLCSSRFLWPCFAIIPIDCITIMKTVFIVIGINNWQWWWENCRGGTVQCCMSTGQEWKLHEGGSWAWVLHFHFFL